MSTDAKTASGLEALSQFAKPEKHESPADYSDAESFFNLPEDDDEDDEDDDGQAKDGGKAKR
jgi:hypothetical protein